MFGATIWGKVDDLYVESCWLTDIIGGKRGRLGYHTWDISLAQIFSKDFTIVRFQ